MTEAAPSAAVPDAAAPRGWVWTPWIAAVVLTFAGGIVHAATHQHELLHGLSDEALLVPLARQAHDPALYAEDHWLQLAGSVFSRTYSWLLGALLSAVDDPVVAVRALAIPFRVLFLAGSFVVVRRTAGARAAWIGTAVLAALPPILAWTGAAAWPLGPGAGLPRDLVFALLPWLWMARAATVDNPVRRRRVLLWLGMGLLAIVHPLTTIHMIALFMIVDAWGRPPGPALRRAMFCGTLALLGAASYVVQWVFVRLRVSTPGEVPREVLQWRIGGIGAATPSVWMNAIELALWLAAAALLVGRGRRTEATRTLRLAAVIALVLAALFPAFNAVVAGIQFDRLARVVVWLAVVIAVIDLPAAWVARDRRALGAVAACVVAGIFGPVVVRAATGADRGALEWIVRRVEVRAGIDADARPELVPNRPRPGDPSLDPALADHFRALCSWVRAETLKNALFAVPPEDWGAFRAYAVRGSVVTRKDGGFALSFLGGRGNDWFLEYGYAVNCYAWRDANHWAEWAAERKFTHAVFDDAAPGDAPAPGAASETVIPPGWQELRRFGPFRVLRSQVR